MGTRAHETINEQQRQHPAEAAATTSATDAVVEEQKNIFAGSSATMHDMDAALATRAAQTAASLTGSVLAEDGGQREWDPKDDEQPLLKS